MKSPDKVTNHIINWLKDYLEKSNLNGFIVGVSGGIDSSVTSTICALTGKKTIVLTMPIKQIKEQQDLSLKHQEWLKSKFKNVESQLIILDNCQLQNTTYPIKIFNLNKNWKRLKLNWHIIYCK